MTTRVIAFSEGVLRDRLARLSIEKILAFSASCAEVLMPPYERYAAAALLPVYERRLYRTTLDRIWSLAIDADSGLDDLKRLEQECLDAIPSEEEAWSHKEPYAEDAGAAVTFTVRVALSGDPQDAVWAARRVYDALDHLVGKLVEPGVGREVAILSHPLIQGEFARQLHDIERLERVGVGDIKRVIVETRDDARVEAIRIFGMRG